MESIAESAAAGVPPADEAPGSKSQWAPIDIPRSASALSERQPRALSSTNSGLLHRSSSRNADEAESESHLGGLKAALFSSAVLSASNGPGGFGSRRSSFSGVLPRPGSGSGAAAAALHDTHSGDISRHGRAPSGPSDSDSSGSRIAPSHSRRQSMTASGGGINPPPISLSRRSSFAFGDSGLHAPASLTSSAFSINELGILPPRGPPAEGRPFGMSQHVPGFSIWDERREISKREREIEIKQMTHLGPGTYTYAADATRKAPKGNMIKSVMNSKCPRIPPVRTATPAELGPGAYSPPVVASFRHPQGGSWISCVSVRMSGALAPPGAVAYGGRSRTSKMCLSERINAPKTAAAANPPAGSSQRSAGSGPYSLSSQLPSFSGARGTPDILSHTTPMPRGLVLPPEAPRAVQQAPSVYRHPLDISYLVTSAPRPLIMPEIAGGAALGDSHKANNLSNSFGRRSNVSSPFSRQVVSPAAGRIVAGSPVVGSPSAARSVSFKPT